MEACRRTLGLEASAWPNRVTIMFPQTAGCSRRHGMFAHQAISIGQVGEGTLEDSTARPILFIRPYGVWKQTQQGQTTVTSSVGLDVTMDTPRQELRQRSLLLCRSKRKFYSHYSTIISSNAQSKWRSKEQG